MVEIEVIQLLKGKSLSDVDGLSELKPLISAVGWDVLKFCPINHEGKKLFTADEYHQWTNLLGFQVGVFFVNGIAIEVQVSPLEQV